MYNNNTYVKRDAAHGVQAAKLCEDTTAHTQTQTLITLLERSRVALAARQHICCVPAHPCIARQRAGRPGARRRPTATCDASRPGMTESERSARTRPAGRAPRGLALDDDSHE